MLFGFVADGGYDIKDDEDEPILDADYYFGTNEDGARHSGWLQYTDALTDYEEDYYWFYFNTSNGKKVWGQMKTINGKKYNFDEHGIMGFKWDEGTVGGVSTTTWFGTLEDGALAKNKWIWNKPYEDVELKSNQEDRDDETPRWFRTDASGNLVKGVTKKVNSKWYVFDTDGVMLTGLVVLDDEDGSVSGAHFEYQYDMDVVTKDAIVKGFEDEDNGWVDAPGKSLHYFSEDEEKDGSMKTGTMKIELADDEYTFCFTKNTGAAKDGYDSSSKKVYNSGILEKAGDDKYKVVPDRTDKIGTDEEDNDIYASYLVGSTGSVVKQVSTYKDANDKYYVYLPSWKENDEYNWYIGATYKEDQAKGIKNNKDSYTVNIKGGTITAANGEYSINLVGIGTKKSSTTD